MRFNRANSASVESIERVDCNNDDATCAYDKDKAVLVRVMKSYRAVTILLIELANILFIALPYDNDNEANLLMLGIAFRA